MPTPTRYRVTYIFDTTHPGPRISELARHHAHTQFPGPVCTRLVSIEVETGDVDDDVTPGIGERAKAAAKK